MWHVQDCISLNTVVGAGQEAISVHGSFSWEEGGDASLTDIDFQVPAGSLVAIVGTTGLSSLTSAEALDHLWCIAWHAAAQQHVAGILSVFT